MRKTVILALKRFDEKITDSCDYIGVDYGAKTLAQKGVRMKYAIGDFDSVHKEDSELIEKYADEVIRLNPIKDDSDSEAAIRLAVEKGYERIILSGGLGGRLDHTYINMRLCMSYPKRVYVRDELNLVYSLPAGEHVIRKEDYPYISFFSEKKAKISLTGFKYPLSERNIGPDDLYTLSNEIISEEGNVVIHEGTVLVIQSKDK